jgi:hypothetical protein
VKDSERKETDIDIDTLLLNIPGLSVILSMKQEGIIDDR